jgi:TRAP-type C4-dicarboxylate transport system permease small subunit
MVLSLVYEVVARYVFDSPTLWAYDMTFMLYGAFFMLGSAYTLQRKGHIRTDSFYGGWSPRRQGIVDAVCYMVMFMPFAAIFLWFGWGYFFKAFMTGETLRQQPLDADHLALQDGHAADRIAAGDPGRRRILQEPRCRDQRTLAGRRRTTGLGREAA